MEKIIELLKSSLENNMLIKLTFSALRKKSNLFKKTIVRPLLLQGELYYQVEYHFTNKVTHSNLKSTECLPLFEELIWDTYKQINLFCVDADYQILASNPENPKIIRRPATKIMPPLVHNREKHHILPDGVPCDFLIRLGVMDNSGRVFQKHYAKFRQINRFLEIVSDVLCFLPDKKTLPDGQESQEPLRIIDFGCGKAYLTFALYHYLKLILGKNVSIIGLDLKTDVIDFCNMVAEDLDYKDLQFFVGDIAEYSEKENIDMVVTLHACDTVTDYALIKAVGWNASVILSVPVVSTSVQQISNSSQPILAWD